MSDVGLDALADIKKLLGVEPEWSLSEQRGFTWWPHAISQRIWATSALKTTE